MIQLGADRGTPVVALLTAMDRPLGFACGNALEVKESIDALSGNGPEDLMEVTYALGAEMLLLARVAENPQDAWKMMQDSIASGKAMEKFREIIQAQGGNPEIIERQDLLASAPVKSDFTAKQDGIVQEVAPRTVGHGVISLRGGRRTMEDRIDPSVGFIITAKPGDEVRRGQPLASIHALDEAGLKEGKRALDEAIRIGEESMPCLPLVSVKITSEGTTKWERPDA
jgi:pyrimidine-nucleoside phosphorylase